MVFLTCLFCLMAKCTTRLQRVVNLKWMLFSALLYGIWRVMHASHIPDRNTAVCSYTKNKFAELSHGDHLLFGVLSQESSLHFIKEKKNNKSFIFQLC